MTFPFETTHLLIAALAVLAAALFVLHVRDGRRLRELSDALAAQAEKLESLNGNLAALLECSRTMGNRIAAGERTQRTMQKRIDMVQQDDANQVAVQHAMKLLDNGWELKEVTDICDLTQGEVEILQNLHQHKAA